MVIERVNLKQSKASMATPENVLSIQAFHQCSSLVSIKLNMSNLPFWRSQVLPLVRSLGLVHHLSENRHASDETMGTETKETHDQSIETWSHNDGLLSSWLLGLMTEEVMLLLDGIETAYDVWNSLEESSFQWPKRRKCNWPTDSEDWRKAQGPLMNI